MAQSRLSSPDMLGLKWTRRRPPHPVKLLTTLFRRYGAAKMPLPRTVIERGILKELTLELRPPKFRVHMLVPTIIPGQSIKAKTVTVSSTDKVSDACRTFAEAIAVDKAATGQYRVWRISSNAGTEDALFPVETLRTCGATLLDGEQGLVEEEFVDSSEEFAVEFMMPTSEWVVNASEISATSAPPPPKSEPLFGNNPDFFAKLERERTIVPYTGTGSGTQPSKSTALTKVSSSSSRGKAGEPGTMGLGNMLVDLTACYILRSLTVTKGQHLFYELGNPVPRTHPRAYGLLPGRCIRRGTQPGQPTRHARTNSAGVRFPALTYMGP